MSQSAKEVLAVKSEATYGTDAFSGDPTELLSAENIQINEVYSDIPVERKTHDGFAHGEKMLRVKSHTDVSFEFDLLAKESAAGDPPPIIGAILKACNFEEVVNAGTDVTYTLVFGADQTKVPSMTVKHYTRDDENSDWYLRTVTGVRGTLTITMQDEGTIRCSFSGIGKFSEEATSTGSYTLPTSYNGGKDPLAAQGLTVEYDATQYDVRSLDFNTNYSQDRYDERSQDARLKKVTLDLADGDFPTSSVTWGEEGTWDTIVQEHKPDPDTDVVPTADFKVTASDGTDTIEFDATECAVGMYSKNQQGGRYAFDTPLTHQGGFSITFT
jgi:hypothetical protein